LVSKCNIALNEKLENLQLGLETRIGAIKESAPLDNRRAAVTVSMALLAVVKTKH
jgi:hypothetical protein